MRLGHNLSAPSQVWRNNTEQVDRVGIYSARGLFGRPELLPLVLPAAYEGADRQLQQNPAIQGPYALWHTQDVTAPSDLYNRSARSRGPRYLLLLLRQVSQT